MIKKAILPVAGFGTRLLPASKAIPKEMISIIDRPAIDYVVQEAIDAGIEHIILVTHSSKTSIEDYFDCHAELEQHLLNKDKPELLQGLRVIPPHVTMSSVRQGRALGLGHAIYAARHCLAPNEGFAVLLPDVLIDAPYSNLKQMIDAYSVNQIAQIMVEPVDPQRVDQYGIVATDQALTPGQSAFIHSMIEKPAVDQAPSNLAVVGRYVLPHDILHILANTPAGQGGEIQLTDAIVQLDQIQAYHLHGQSFDCGHPAGYFSATLHYAKQHPTLGHELCELIKNA
ncbi:UTP--glucose-1-phosphate uridylyltransferase [uncultured Acinetobacter sp.]|uniref:UTP--glucose-1-phosphate uridylyltransferase n=1 Tax=Acinetobacter sp. TaxID=472 RepID=UPI002623D282|nr:UTP--glucose-1-phosphate uridylyltransferase [uncultured Acinetobacter sp.]